MENCCDRIFCLSIDLTNKIIETYKYLQAKEEKIFSDRLLRSGIEVGVRIFDAQKATGIISYLERLEVALLFTNDTIYWINVLCINNLITQGQFCEIEALSLEIRCFLTNQIYALKAIR